jgi:tryptophan synthase alpha chain
MLAYGLARFVADAAQAGIDGLIVPDLPVEEAGELDALCADHDLALIYFLAPTSTPERIVLVTQRARGFIYLVSLTGVTGARASLPADLSAFIHRVREQARCPLAVGFGISTPEQAASIGRDADGVIVGSALVATVKSANGNAPEAAGAFVRSLSLGLKTSEVSAPLHVASGVLRKTSEV